MRCRMILWGGRLDRNWYAVALPWVQIIEPLVVADRKRNSLQNWGIVVEEADESGYWMELIIEGNLLSANKIGSLLDGANQITAIMVASRKSAQLALLASKKKKP